MIESVGTLSATPTIGLAASTRFLSAARSGTAEDAWSAFESALESVTDRFVIVVGAPGSVQIIGRGSGVTRADEDQIRSLLEEPVRLTAAGWFRLPAGPDTAVVVDDACTVDALSVASTLHQLVVQNHQLAAAAERAESEVEALRSVATRILGARELGDALLAVTNETLSLLKSDIAGVMLRDGDEIVMSACAGNQLADTGNLRMRRGQGLAGHVFATGRAAKVDDYLRNDVISDDFNYLARAEKTRSALGAPLVIRGEVIGVLEVWRRRESVFTENDIRRLVALADLAAIALDNARQHEMSAASGRAVVEAHSALRVQLGKVEHALLGQQALIEALIDGEHLAGIARIVVEQTQCDIAILDRDLELLAGTHTAADLARVRAAVRSAPTGQARAGTHWIRAGEDSRIALRAVSISGEVIGWIALLTGAATGDEAVELAATQAALTFSLHHLEQQAAAKARASMREDLLLNLLRGSADERRGAVARAKNLQIDLRGPMRIAVCNLTGLNEVAAGAGWSSPNLERVRRRLLQRCDESLARSGVLRLSAGNVNALVALIGSPASVDLHATLTGIAEELTREMPHCRPIWGVSAPQPNAQQLDLAHTEATTAAKVLRQDSVRQVSFFENLGVLALLAAGPQGVSLTQFAQDTLGPILQHDRQHGTDLVETLRVYLDVNCSQKDTAAKLFIHQKTVKYRLGTIEKLTSLDLHEHRDRMRADIAVSSLDLQ